MPDPEERVPGERHVCFGSGSAVTTTEGVPMAHRRR